MIEMNTNLTNSKCQNK